MTAEEIRKTYCETTLAQVILCDMVTNESISDPTRIRAVAHPLRITLLDVLADEGAATATRCAELTGTTVANCSFHLRTLAKHGYIERVDQAGREKPWQLVQRGRRFMPDFEDPASIRATQELGAVQVAHEAERAQEWIRRAQTEDPQWIRASTTASSSFWVTVEELAEISREIEQLSARFVGRQEDPSARPPGARRARLFATTHVDPEENP